LETTEERGHARRSAHERTSFDSTGLAVQDLAIAILAFAEADGLDRAQIPA
jgi:ornithine cyclodeaminase/alanine dehydrogenase-like protein (mu-crystallin family)